MMLENNQQIVLHSVGRPCGVANVRRRCRHRLFELRDRARNSEPNEQGKNTGNSSKVEKNANRTWEPELTQPLDAGTHRGCPRQPKQEEKDQKPQVPQRKRSSDNAHDHGRNDKGATDGAHSPETDQGRERKRGSERSRWRSAALGGPASRDARAIGRLDASAGTLASMRAWRRLGALLLVVVAAAVAAVAANSASGRRLELTPADRHELLQRFMPILYFHGDEAWAPVAVERFLQGARRERQTARGVWTRTATPLPTSTVGCTLTPCYRLNLPCSLKGGAACYEKAAATLSDWEHPVIYGRVLDVPAGTPMPPGISGTARYLVRYWLFYSFDDWRSRGERLWQAHEGDWENISVALDANANAIFAAYSQHCSGTVRAWSKVTRRQTHPIDYVALGSHANYFTQTTSPTQFLRCVYKNVAKADRSKARRLVGAVQSGITDRTGTAHALGSDVQQTALELVDVDTALPAWGRFPGRWSEGELLWIGRTPTRFTRVRSGLGPATPHWNTTSVPALWHSDSS